MMFRHLLVLGLAACGSKSSPPTSPTPTAPTPAPAAKLAVGPIGLGCFAYSPARHAAACITGNYEGEGKGKTQIEFVHGSEGVTPITDAEITAAFAATIDPLLAKGGYVAITGGDKLEIDKPLHGVSWTVDGQRDRLAVTCDGVEKPLLAVEGKELKVKVTALEGAILVEVSIRLGEPGTGVLAATLVDSKTCERLDK